MFKLTNKELRDPHFIRAMAKLINCPDFEYKTAYNIMRASKVLETKLKDSQKEWVTLGKKYIKLDGKGNFLAEEGKFVFQENINPEEAEKTIEEFMAKEHLVDRHKFKLDLLAPAKLTPNEISTIEFMIEE
jgi:hypothetical protein